MPRTSTAGAHAVDAPVRGALALVPAPGERCAAVIDLGSNSWRFVAYRYAPRGAWRRIAGLREPVRIAEGLAATGRVDPERAALGLAALEAFAAYGRALGVGPRDTSVVATSALRDAGNGGAVLARARAATGLEIRTIGAEEEARYGYLAAVNSTTLTDGFALDLGGGSLQLVAVGDRMPLRSASWPLGAVRVTESLLPGDRPVSSKQLRRARAQIRSRLGGLRGLPMTGPRIVAMGGAARNLAGAALAARGGAPTAIQGALLTAADLRELIDALSERPPSRRALPGIKAARADIILGAALVLEAVLAETGAEGFEITRAGLREGVFFAERLLAGASPVLPDVRAATVHNLVAQHSIDVARAEQVAALALELQESLGAATGLATVPGERELLWAAAMLHELGAAIDLGDQPLHARYVLLNSELYGYSPREVALLAQVVRHHRKGMPGLDDLERLARPADHETVARCAVLLRIAAQLAPGRAAGPARLVADGEGLRVELAGDARLTRWALARLAQDDALSAAFGRPLLATAQ